MLVEFRKFIARGNVIDMAVGIIIGAAFTAIVTSLVDDLINPLIGVLVGGVDFSGLSLSVGAGENAATFAYGSFITAVINFLLVAWVVFLLVKAVNKVEDLATGNKEDNPASAPGPSEKDILIEIRDALQAQRAD
ncbi:MAG: large-conductance mechanosensitive channel protein MscL [Pseudomonadota bacterium]